MKKLFSILFSLFLYTTVSFADDRVALMYNIIPDDDSKNNSIVDSRIQKKLGFKLFRAQGAVYFNSQEVNVVNGRFEIDLNGLIGKQELKFTNDQNEEAIFTYYVADENGLVKDYMLENEQAYVKTVENAKVVYTTKDAKKIDYVAELIAKMPEVTKTNLKEITLLPTEHTSRAAGITDYNKVTLYNLSTYTDKEIQRIVTHEIAHTWAHELRKAKVIDYSYTNFGNAVKADGNVVTDYSKNSLSEDFADSVALYLANADSFTKNFPARANYIANLF